MIPTRLRATSWVSSSYGCMSSSNNSRNTRCLGKADWSSDISPRISSGAKLALNPAFFNSPSLRGFTFNASSFLSNARWTLQHSQCGYASTPVENKSSSSATECAPLSTVRSLNSSLDVTLLQLLENRQRVHKKSLVAAAISPTRAKYRDLLEVVSKTVSTSHPRRKRTTDDVTSSSSSSSFSLLHLGNSNRRVLTNEDAAAVKARITELKTAFIVAAAIEEEEREELKEGVVLDETEPTKRSVHMQFYEALLASSLISSEPILRVAVDAMREDDGILFDAQTGRAAMLSLMSLSTSTESGEFATQDAQEGIATPSASKQPGELVFYYFGRILRDMQRSNNNNNNTSVSDQHAAAQLWGLLFTACVMSEAAAKLFDLWWERFLKALDGDDKVADSSVHGGKEVGHAAVPYYPFHCALTWCTSHQDVERALRVFSTANQRGVVFPSTEERRILGSGQQGVLTHPFSHADLTARATQEFQLRALVRLLSVAKSIKMDGGIREKVVRDIRRLIPSEILKSAPWGVVNDLMSGLSMPSAMRLLKFCSSHGETPQEERSAHTSGDREVPFMIWASLLRRCAREHHIAESESLFKFLCESFPLSSEEKRELVEIVLRMYATLPQPDFSSALHVFLDHVVAPPRSADAETCTPARPQPVVKPDTILVNLLLRAADSRNAAMMVFLESCADGVNCDRETFEYLLSTNPFSAVQRLNRKLPHGYTTSALDSQLRIPADVDAHLRREEALRQRGKPLYDSTGEVV